MNISARMGVDGAAKPGKIANLSPTASPTSFPWNYSPTRARRRCRGMSAHFQKKLLLQRERLYMESLREFHMLSNWRILKRPGAKTAGHGSHSGNSRAMKKGKL